MGRTLLIVSDVIFIVETLTLMFLFIAILMNIEIAFEKYALNKFIDRVSDYLKSKVHRNR